MQEKYNPFAFKLNPWATLHAHSPWYCLLTRDRSSPGGPRSEVSIVWDTLAPRSIWIQTSSHLGTHCTLCTGHSPAPGAGPRGVCRPGPCRWPRRRSPASGPRPGGRRSSRQLDCKLKTTMNNCYTSFFPLLPIREGNQTVSRSIPHFIIAEKKMGQILWQWIDCCVKSPLKHEIEYRVTLKKGFSDSWNNPFMQTYKARVVHQLWDLFCMNIKQT